MLQIWGLILFFDLLAQSSAQLQAIPAVPSSALSPALTLTSQDLSGLSNELTKGLQNSPLLDVVRNLPITDILKTGLGSQGGLLGGLLPKVSSLLPGLQQILSIEVTNPVLLELGLQQSPNSDRLFVKIPLGMVLKLKTFLTGELVNLDVKLNIILELKAVRTTDGKYHLVIGDCKNDPGSIKITLLGGAAPPLVQNLVDTLTTALTQHLPNLLQKEVCPLLNDILNHIDVALMHTVAEKLFQGSALNLTV